MNGPACGCPERDGKIYHQRGSCADPVVAKLGWYADGPALGCPACGWPGSVYGSPLVWICPNPGCQVFSWTTNPELKIDAEQVYRAMLEGGRR